MTPAADVGVKHHAATNLNLRPEVREEMLLKITAPLGVTLAFKTNECR